MVKAAKSVGALEKMSVGKLVLTTAPQSKKPMDLALGSQATQIGGITGNVQWAYSNHLTPIQK